MNFSESDIDSFERRYNLKLPTAYKSMLRLIGKKLIDAALKSSLYENLYSIYDIQDQMRDSIQCVEDYDISTLFNPNDVFFLNFHSYKDEVTNIAYFIQASGQKDSQVYSWETDIAYDDNIIKKFANGIEEWLLKTNCFLYIEFQAKKMCRSN